MKLDVIQKLDEIIEAPTRYTQEEKLNILSRVVRDISVQVRGHYTDISLLRAIVEKVQATIEELDNKLFGDREKEGIIYELSSSIKELNAKMAIIVWVGVIVAGAIILNIIGNVLSIPQIKSFSEENQANQTEIITK
jgi:hypothetical protein